jgi:hypothetical protein
MMSEVCSPYSGVCFLKRNDVITFGQMTMHPIQYDRCSIVLGKLANICACAVLWFVLNSILYKLHEVQDLGWFQWVESLLICRWLITSWTVTRWLLRIVVMNRSMFFFLVDVEGFPGRFSSAIFVLPFLNIVIHSYTLRCVRALFPYCAECLGRIFAPRIFSTHKNSLTVRYSSLQHAGSRAAM